MDLLPQPPPDAPAPPPGPEAIRSRRIMKNILWLGAVSIALILLSTLVLPVIFRTKGPHYVSGGFRLLAHKF
jgi:hypothetical protein